MRLCPSVVRTQPSGPVRPRGLGREAGVVVPLASRGREMPPGKPSRKVGVKAVWETGSDGARATAEPSALYDAVRARRDLENCGSTAAFTG
jgi:hypothetical protein